MRETKPCATCEMLRQRLKGLRSRNLHLQRQLQLEQANSARLTQELRDSEKRFRAQAMAE